MDLETARAFAFYASFDLSRLAGNGAAVIVGFALKCFRLGTQALADILGAYGTGAGWATSLGTIVLIKTLAAKFRRREASYALFGTGPRGTTFQSATGGGAIGTDEHAGQSFLTSDASQAGVDLNWATETSVVFAGWSEGGFAD